MVNKRLVGIVAGIVVAVALASLFSIASVQAQMMQHSQVQQHHFAPPEMMKHHAFSAQGISMVSDVRVSGIAVTGDNAISASLIYAGNGSAPSVTVIAMTNHMQMMGMMPSSKVEGMSGMMGSHMAGMNDMGMMAGQSMMGSSISAQTWYHPDMPRWNATQWQHWHSQITQPGWSPGYFSPMQPLTGSSIMDGGWRSGSTITILLDGEISDFDASDIHVQVFPHLA